MLGFSRIGGLIGALALAAACTDASPTAPDPRSGLLDLRITGCDTSGQSPLQCRAQVFCTGSYRCPDPSLDRVDITEQGRWISRDPDLFIVVGPGRFQQIGIGDGVASVSYTPQRYYELTAIRPVSVFPGTAPLPTRALTGNVFEAGRSPNTGGIQGAVVEILDGLVAGRTGTTGVVPAPVAGFVRPFLTSFQYAILGVPPGRYVVRAQADGYLAVQRAATVTSGVQWDDGGTGDFQLTKR